MGIYIKGIDSLDGFNTYITTRLPHALKYKRNPKGRYGCNFFTSWTFN